MALPEPLFFLAIIGLLFVLGLPINTLWYTLFLPVLRRTGRLDPSSPFAPKARPLRRKIVLAAVLVTLVSCTVKVLWSDTEPSWMADAQEPLLKTLVVLAASALLMSMVVVRLGATSYDVITAHCKAWSSSQSFNLWSLPASSMVTGTTAIPHQQLLHTGQWGPCYAWSCSEHWARRTAPTICPEGPRKQVYEEAS